MLCPCLFSLGYGSESPLSLTGCKEPDFISKTLCSMSTKDKPDSEMSGSTFVIDSCSGYRAKKIRDYGIYWKETEIVSFFVFPTLK